MAYDPFDGPMRAFKNKQSSLTDQSNSGNADYLKTVQMSREGEKGRNIKTEKPTEINLPKHLYIPAGAESLDIRRVINVPPATVDYELMSITAPAGSQMVFTNYGVYNDGDNGINYEFRPSIDGSRIFRYHGDPTQNYKIYLGLAPDLSNASMIPCQLTLLPGQTLKWLITNTSTVNSSMGVRMTGYLDTSSIRVQSRFGG